MHPEEAREFKSLLREKGFDVSEPIERARSALATRVGRAQDGLPLPPADVGYPVKGLYEGIYASLVAGEYFGACLLLATAVEYSLKDLIYARNFGFDGFDWMKWQDLELDDMQYNGLLDMARGYFSKEEFNRLDLFRKKRNDLVHLNLIKLTTPGELSVQEVTVERVESARMRTSFLPGVAWMSFVAMLSESAVDLFIEGDGLVHLVWQKARTR